MRPEVEIDKQLPKMRLCNAKCHMRQGAQAKTLASNTWCGGMRDNPWTLWRFARMTIQHVKCFPNGIHREAAGRYPRQQRCSRNSKWTLIAVCRPESKYCSQTGRTGRKRGRTRSIARSQTKSWALEEILASSEGLAGEEMSRHGKFGGNEQELVS